MIADGDCVLHRRSRHLDGLHDERHAEQGHDDGHDGRLKIFANDGLRRSELLFNLRFTFASIRAHRPRAEGAGLFCGRFLGRD